jgi:hypothetical protein
MSFNQIGQPNDTLNLDSINDTLVEVRHTFLVVELTNSADRQSLDDLLDFLPYSTKSLNVM